MRSRRVLAYAWTLPLTAVGLVLALLVVLAGGRARVVQGVLEVHGWLSRLGLRYCTLLRGGASAITVGHVVIGRDESSLELTRPHERVHVRQCERWGPLFVPAYVLAGLLMLIRGKHLYRDNPFEREAFEKEGQRPAV